MKPEKEGLERVRGLEPPLRAWKAIVLPLHHTRAEYPMPAPGTGRQELSSSVSLASSFFGAAIAL